MNIILPFDELVSKLTRIKAWLLGDKIAPHKPFLILCCLVDFYQRKMKIWKYEDIEHRMIALLERYTKAQPRPYYPFVRLVNDDLWLVTADEFIDTKRDYPGEKLKSLNAIGSFTEEISSSLEAYSSSIPDIIGHILDENFPVTIHEEILDMTGFLGTIVRQSRRRNPEFRQEILVAYGFRCAVCGINPRLRNSLIGIEAAHIKWHSARGPDHATNGLALCSLHHKLFDTGAYTLSTDFKIQISQFLNGGAELDQVIFDYHEHRIILPRVKTNHPSPEYIKWHNKNVFK